MMNKPLTLEDLIDKKITNGNEFESLKYKTKSLFDRWKEWIEFEIDYNISDSYESESLKYHQNLLKEIDECIAQFDIVKLNSRSDS